MSDNQYANIEINSGVIVYDTPFYEGVGAPANGSLPLFQDSASQAAPNPIARLLRLNPLLRRVVLGIVQAPAVYP